MISINAKRLMAYVLAMAMLLAGLVYVPKTADAAEEDTATPEVSVMGATLRLSGEKDNKGTQSMRVGIKVSNASKAKSCAIKLTVNGKSYTVSTEPVEEGKVDKQHNFVHSYDENTDSIVYAVVITGIPESSFYDQIRITGYASEIKENESDEEKEPAHSSTEARNVMGVVESLQRKYPDLNIKMKDGILYNGKDNTALTAEDFGEGNNEGEHPSELEGIVDLSTISTVTNNPGATGSYDAETGQVTINDDSYKDGYLFKLPEMAKLGDKVHVKINGSFTGSHNAFRMAIGIDGTSNWDHSDMPKVAKGTEAEKLNFDYIFTMQEKAGQCKGEYLRITSLSSWDADGSNPITNLTIDKITVEVLKPVVLAPGEVDLSTIESDAGATGTYDAENGNVIFSDTDYRIYRFKLPTDVAAGDRVRVSIKGSFTGEHDKFRVFIGTKDVSWNKSEPHYIEAGDAELLNDTYTFTVTDASQYLIIVGNRNPDTAITNLTINKITAAKLAPDEVDLSSIKQLDNNAAPGRYDTETGKVTINDEDKSYPQGYVFDLPTGIKVGDRVLVTINGKFAGNNNGFRVAITNPYASGWGEEKISEIDTVGGSTGNLNYMHTFTITNVNENSKYLRIAHNYASIKNLTINKITVTKLNPGEEVIDLSTVAQKQYYDAETGKIVIDDDSSITGQSEAHIKLPKTLPANVDVQVTVKGSYTGDSGFRFWIGDGGNALSDIKVHDKSFDKQEEYEDTFTLKTKAECNKFTIKGLQSWANGKDYINGLEIERIIITYPEQEEEAEPTN